jgi:hypothetical protein
MKNIFREDKKGKGNYTSISNDILQSKTLKPDEIGVLVYLLSLPENFEIHKTNIWRKMNIGRNGFNKIWNILIQSGHIKTTKTFDIKSGRWDGYRHQIFEIPVFTENGETGNTLVDRTPASRNLDNLKSGSIKRNTIKEPEKENSHPESDHRNEVEEDSDHTILELVNNGPDEKNVEGTSNFKKELVQIVPDSPLRCGGVGNNDRNQMVDQKQTFQSETRDIAEEHHIMDNNTFIELSGLLNEQFKQVLPNWKKYLMKNSLEVFLHQTKSFHNGNEEWIELFAEIKKKLQSDEETI